MRTGRPRKTAEELKKSGAKPFKVAQRLAEEQAAAGIAAAEKERELEAAGRMSLSVFIAQVKRERESFFERLVPGKSVCREYGAEFNWREEHPLTVIRTYAEQVANGAIVAGELTRRACARFLGDLKCGADRELFIDPIAVENIATWFKCFGEPGLSLQPWELFIVGQLLGWKRPTHQGNYPSSTEAYDSFSRGNNS